MTAYETFLALNILLSISLVTRADNSTIDQEAPKPRQPNIVFVFADDLGFHDVGYHGAEIKTPVLDKLAASGVKLENYYVQPLCTPSRSQLMSGRYQIHTGLQHSVIVECQDNGLPTDSPTLADKMKESGYATHMVGKWNLGQSRKEYLPHNRGFDSFYGYLLPISDYFDHSWPYRGKRYVDLRFNDQPIRNETGHYSTNLFTDRAVGVVEKHDKTKPLFLYLAYQAVHGPLEVPDRYLEDYKDISNINRRKYAGMAAAMDEGIGNLTDSLKANGLWDNTIFVFSTDNGGDPRSGASNYPLRGRKFTLFEGGVRGVGFVAGGALKASGVVNRELIHVSDWFPTLIGLAGGNLNGTKPLDGFDQWETISESSPSKRNVVLHNIDPLSRKGGNRMFSDTFDTRTKAALRMGNYKLITGYARSVGWGAPEGQNLTVPSVHDPPDKNVWLFNIAEDPNEEHDLSASHPDMVRTLLGVLQNFDDTSVPARYPGPDPRCDPAKHGDVWGPWL